MKRFHSAFVVSIIACYLNAADHSLLNSLNDDMIQASALATQTNQNIDYQPFILSVYHGSDLSKFGIRTLGEALLLVPGVDMASNNMNNRTPIFRGSNPTAYGQSALVVDGYLVNDSLFNSYNPYLDLPIELIERIEVVRGSGSFIEGVNGYAGTINVKTYPSESLKNKTKSVLFTHIGSDDGYGAGGWSQYNGDHYRLSLDIFTQSHNQQTPITVTDQLGERGIAHLGMKHEGFGITYQSGPFELKGRYNDYHNDAAFGALYLLPNEDGTIKQPSWYLQGKYSLQLTRDLSMSLKSSIMENTYHNDSRIALEGTPYDGPYGPIVFTDGEWADLMFKTRRIQGSGNLYYHGFDSHALSFGMESIWDESVDMHSWTTDLTTGVGMVDYTDTPYAFINANDAKRQTTNVYLSDTITLNDTMAIALTLGVLQASDIESKVYTRAALVYQPTPHDIFKLMAGNGVRYPSFQEMYIFPTPYAVGNTDLTQEQVRSFETQYLHKLTSDLTVGINLFYLINSDQIVRDSTNTFQNFGDRIIKGGEAELRGKFTPDDFALLSYSYIDAKGKNLSGTTCDAPYAASHLFKAAYSYDLSNALTLGGVWHYVGEKKRSCDDPRKEALKSYTTTDLALGWNMNTHKGWYLQAIIKNISDTVIRYPSPPSTYPEDYPIAERTFWLHTGWKF